MQLGDIPNPEALAYGRPLDGIRILALEQMQALPYATQLLARLGATVVKVENPGGGDLGRSSAPALKDPDGRNLGATFLRNNLNKKSICIDLKAPEGRRLLLDLVPHFDVVAENFKGGALAKLGLAYADVAAAHPSVVYLSISGFGNVGASPYGSWPAYAPVAEAMSGVYDFKREPGRPPVVSPVGGLGDIGTALYGVIGILAALRHRDATGLGQYVDISMFDAMVAMTDVVTNFWSMGVRPEPGAGLAMIMDGFPASNGWFIIQIGRENDFEKLAKLIGHPEWLEDPRLSTRAGWRTHMDDVIRPAVAEWAADRTNLEAARDLGAAGIASGPCFTAAQVIADEHVAARHMLVELESGPVGDPVVVPGNPVKMSKVADGGDTRVPYLGEHTNEVLALELGLDEPAIAELRSKGIVS